jgi:hypothetical protein
MHEKIKLFFFKTTWLLVLLSSPSIALNLEFTAEAIPVSLEHSIDIIPMKGTKDISSKLLIIETPSIDERESQLLNLQVEPERKVKIFTKRDESWFLELSKALPSSMDLVDVIETSENKSLAGLQDGKIMRLNIESGMFEYLLSSSSMFVGRNWTSSPKTQMFLDLNEDGYDDFLMPSFSGWEVAVSKNGEFKSLQTLGPLPRMSYRDNVEYVGYRSNSPFGIDANIDGMADLAFWINGKFSVYLQKIDGSFSEDPIALDPKQNDVLGDYFQIDLGENADNREGMSRLLDGVEDVDGDGLKDLILKNIKAEGIFGWESQYEIYRGINDNNGLLGFETAASSTIKTRGYQLSNDYSDLTGDGKQEFVITSVDVGIGTIIKALLTRSVSTDVSIYKMVGQVFEDRPSISKSVSVSFDFSNGELFVPAVLSADINGDGLKDLLVQRGTDTLLVYLAEKSSQLFSKKAIRLKLELPKSRDGFIIEDLNSDGRDELILLLTHSVGDPHISIINFD